MINKMEKVLKNGQMGQFMKDNIYMVKNMVKDNLNGLMDLCIK